MRVSGYQNSTPNYGSAALPAMMGNGDFSSILPTQTPPHSTTSVAGDQIHDYRTCSDGPHRAYPTSSGQPCVAIPNNMMANATSGELAAPVVDPVSKNLVKFMAVPTDAAAGPYNNLAYTVDAPINDDLYSLRVDQNIGQNNKLYGSYSQADMPVIDLFTLPARIPARGKFSMAASAARLRTMCARWKTGRSTRT